MVTGLNIEARWKLDFDESTETVTAGKLRWEGSHQLQVSICILEFVVLFYLEVPFLWASRK